MGKSQCFNRILSFHQPGGESTRSSDLSPTGKIILRLISGDSYGYSGYVEGEVTGVNLDSHSVFSNDCFEVGCFEGGGIWTTAVPTQISREVDGETQYWVGGTTDAQGAIWYVDVGTVCQPTGEFAIKDFFVPISVFGKFETRVEIPVGLKVAVLKRVTATTVETVAHYFGPYLIPDRLTRVKPGYALNYSAIDQATDIEEIAMSLSSLLLSNYRHDKKGRKVYYLKGDSDVDLVQIVEQNLSRLSRLVDTLSVTKRYGSIPRFVATYSEPSQLYGPLADHHYNNRIVRLFEEGCFTEGCFEVRSDLTLVSREVQTRAIAWVVYALSLYSYYWKEDKYNYLLETLGIYLLNQINHKTGLPSFGWTHADTLNESTEILEYEFSTAVMVAISCLKLYDIQEDLKYLQAAADVYEGIFDHLFSYKSQNFYHSLSNLTETVDTLIYGGIFTSAFRRVDLAETHLNKMEGLLRERYGKDIELYLRDENEDLILDSNGDYRYEVVKPLTKQGLERFPDEYSLITVGGLSPLEASNTNFWITSILEYFALNHLETKQQLPIAEPFTESITTLLTSASCLDSEANYLERIIIELPIKEFEQHLFHSNFLFDRLRSMWPLEYSWVSQQALSYHGNLGKLLKAFTRSLAASLSFLNRSQDGTFLSKARSASLDRYAQDFGYTRFRKEGLREFRERVGSYLTTQEKGITERGLRSKLLEFEVTSIIRDLYKNIQTTNTFLKVDMTSELGKGFYHGNRNSAAVIEVEIPQPIVKTLIDVIEKEKAAGIKVFYVERIQFEEEMSLGNFSCVNTTANDSSTNYILQEDGALVLSEESSRLVNDG